MVGKPLGRGIALGKPLGSGIALGKPLGIVGKTKGGG
jgi:hypothetical protein